MCGRIGLPQLTWAQFHAWQSGTFDWDEFYRENGTEMSGPSWNLKPTQTVDIVFPQGDGMMCAPARWWFIPHWFNGSDPKEWKQTTFNARLETAHEKPTFRTAWASRRCLIPAAFYYEWTGEKGKKQPHYIAPQSNAPAFFFAGLHSQLASGLRTCTILTRDAEPSIAHIHHRMPLILSQDEIEPWLSCSANDDEVIADFGRSWAERVTTHPVEKFGIKDDGPELIEPIAQGGLF